MVQIIKIPEFEEYIQTHGMYDNRKPWSEMEVEILKEYYGIIPTVMLREKLGRSIKAIHDKAGALGIKVEENRKKREEVSE